MTCTTAAPDVVNVVSSVMYSTVTDAASDVPTMVTSNICAASFHAHSQCSRSMVILIHHLRESESREVRAWRTTVLENATDRDFTGGACINATGACTTRTTA